MRRTECFNMSGSRLEPSSLNLNLSKRHERDSFIAGKQSLNSSRTQVMNNLFKVPNFESIPTRRTTLKKQASPKRRVQCGRVKNELKLSQQSKVTFRPSATFLNLSRNSLHSNARNNHVRKELIKKMVYLAEFAMKNKEDIKHSAPAPPDHIYIPKGTPRIREYITLPEFTKKAPNIQEIRTPLKDFIRKEMVSTSVSKTPTSIKKKQFTRMVDKQDVLNNSYMNEEDCVNSTVTELFQNSVTAQPETVGVKSNLSQTKPEVITQILGCFQSYNTQMNEVLKKLQSVENCFEKAVNDLPENAIYNEFCGYQAKRQELNDRIKILEEELSTALKDGTNVRDKLNSYFRENRELFEKQVQLHREFEGLVQSETTKLLSSDKVKTPTEKTNDGVEDSKPKLRRSLRLSKIPKKEVTPLRKKLSRLNTMSRGIQKAKKSPSTRKGKVLRL